MALFENQMVGVSKNEPQRNRFFLFFELLSRKLWTIILANLLFLLFSIPIITIGPALSALHYVMRKLADQKPVFLMSDFTEAFKSNFKQSLGMFVINLVVGTVAVISFLFYMNLAEGNLIMYIPVGVVTCGIFVFIMANFYTFLQISTCNLTLWQIIKNSIFLCFLGIGGNLVTLIVFLLIFIGHISLFITAFMGIFVIGIPVGIFLLCVTIGIVGFLTTFNGFYYLEKYVISRGETSSEDEDTEKIFEDMGKELKIKTRKIKKTIK